ncbi:MAG: alpha/beta hydrolase [Frankiaceae bacterium]
MERTTPLSSGTFAKGKIPHVPRPSRRAAGAQLWLLTIDGERINARHQLAADGSRGVAIVVVHGFNGGLAKPAVRAVASGLGRHAGVLLLDLRGHGRSSGRSTLGDREIHDVEAAVAAARRLGYRQVVTCGWSMGASVVLRHAALAGGVDAVVAVSGPSAWYVTDTRPMRRVMWLVRTTAGRAVCRGLYGLRLGPVWTEPPESPLEVVGRVAPTPLLIVHGDRDHYFGVEHARALAAAAGEPTELWIVRGMGHAEAGASPELLDRIGGHVRTVLSRSDEPDLRAGERTTG